MDIYGEYVSEITRGHKPKSNLTGAALLAQKAKIWIIMGAQNQTTCHSYVVVGVKGRYHQSYHYSSFNRDVQKAAQGVVWYNFTVGKGHAHGPGRELQCCSFQSPKSRTTRRYLGGA